jgi:hypothetical protein
MSEEADKMFGLFTGYLGMYGTYKAEERNLNKNKLEIKKTARTIREPVTTKLWEAHLKGEQPLGIIPVDEKGRVKWAVIDVDRYDVNHAELVEKLARHKLPLVVCRSKSGGAHLFAFFRDWTNAADVQYVMRSICAALGLGTSEIFPKQAEVLYARGDSGSWLNMPYFDATKTTRGAVKSTGATMTLKEFLRHVESKICTLEELLAAVGEGEKTQSTGATSSHEFDDGPPCLQYLTKLGFPEGTRNHGLIALGVLAKKKYESDWEVHLEEWNNKYMSPPLSTEEVQTVVKYLRKKDYNYRCKDQPLCNHCNSQVCITRRFGVGDEGNFPIIAGLSVLNTEPPLWFMDVNGQRIEMTTDDLQIYKRFQKLCMERLHIVFPMLKQDTWLAITREAMKNVIVLEAPPEVSVPGMFLELLIDFCRDKSSTTDREGILIGRVFEDEETQRFYFRLRDLQDYLERAKFDLYTRGQITSRIKDVGGGVFFFNIKGQGVNTWFVPSTLVRRVHLEVPKSKEQVL